MSLEVFNFDQFEMIARALTRLVKEEPATEIQGGLVEHPFDARNIHPLLPQKARALFDDGHFSESTFEAFKFVDRFVGSHAHVSESGFKLMMAAFDEASPKLRLTPMKTTSEKDEQKGYRFIFAGGVLAIRNPRGHEYNITDDPDICLDHLSFLSMLLRRLERAGFR